MTPKDNLYAKDWQQALHEARPDFVAWIHEDKLDATLVKNMRGLLNAAAGTFAGELSIEGGESLKGWPQIEKILGQFQDWGLTRSSVLVTTGGGALSDAMGFAAALWKRGIHLIHIPTTPLAAVDAAWGGKTGINWGGSKNQLGTFTDPLAVHVDARWMRTLPLREFRAGLAEVAKHAMLDDQAFTDLQLPLPSWPPTDNGDVQGWTDLLKRSAQVKRQIVFNDPEERGERCMLNLGHTVGHAVEACTAQTTNPWLHGEAVALGLHFALFEMTRLDLSPSLPDSAGVQQAQWMARWLHTHVPVPENWGLSADDLWKHMIHDKKNAGGEVRDLAWRGVGNVVWPVHWKRDTFEATWQAFVRSWNSAHLEVSN